MVAPVSLNVADHARRPISACGIDALARHRLTPAATRYDPPSVRTHRRRDAPPRGRGVDASRHARTRRVVVDLDGLLAAAIEPLVGAVEHVPDQVVGVASVRSRSSSLQRDPSNPQSLQLSVSRSSSSHVEVPSASSGTSRWRNHSYAARGVRAAVAATALGARGRGGHDGRGDRQQVGGLPRPPRRRCRGGRRRRRSRGVTLAGSWMRDRPSAPAAVASDISSRTTPTWRDMTARDLRMRFGSISATAVVHVDRARHAPAAPRPGRGRAGCRRRPTRSGCSTPAGWRRARPVHVTSPTAKNPGRPCAPSRPAGMPPQA